MLTVGDVVKLREGKYPSATYTITVAMVNDEGQIRYQLEGSALRKYWKASELIPTGTPNQYAVTFKVDDEVIICETNRSDLIKIIKATTFGVRYILERDTKIRKGHEIQLAKYSLF